MSATRVRALLALVVLVGTLPHLFVLNLWPASRDAATWIVRSDPARSDWARFVFATQHFAVGYRPVTALSYAVDHAIGGWSALPYRATDLALHAACAVSISLLVQRLAPSLPRWGGPCAAALFVAHPLASQVVPHLARRAYSLSSFLSLAGILTLCPPREARTPARRTARTLAGGLLLAAAALAHEIGYAAAVAALLAVLHRTWPRAPRERWRLAVVTLTPTALLLAALLALRGPITGRGMGGYDTAAAQAGRALPIVVANTQALLGLVPLRDDLDAVPGLSWLLAGVGLAYCLGRAIAAALPGRPHEARVHGVWLGWLGALSAAFALAGVWFPRQAYTAVVPLAAWLGVTLADTPRVARTRAMLGAHLAPQLALIGVIAFQSPVWRGTDPTLKRGWQAIDRVTREAYAAVAPLPRTARVDLVIPFYQRPSNDALRARDEPVDGVPFGARQAEIWLEGLCRARVSTRVLVVRDPLDPGPPPSLEIEPGALRIDPRGHQVLLPHADAGHTEPSGRQTLPLEPDAERRPTHVYFHDGARGELRIVPESDQLR